MMVGRARWTRVGAYVPVTRETPLDRNGARERWKQSILRYDEEDTRLVAGAYRWNDNIYVYVVSPIMELTRASLSL